MQGGAGEFPISENTTTLKVKQYIYRLSVLPSDKNLFKELKFKKYIYFIISKDNEIVELTEVKAYEKSKFVDTQDGFDFKYAEEQFK